MVVNYLYAEQDWKKKKDYQNSVVQIKCSFLSLFIDFLDFLSTDNCYLYSSRSGR